MGLRRTAGLYVTPSPVGQAICESLGLPDFGTFNVHITTHCTERTLRCTHSKATLTRWDAHVSDLQILDITVAHHCARGFTGKGEAVGCAVLPDKHTSYVQDVLFSTIFCTYIQL